MEDSISPAEFILLLAALCLPAASVGIVVQLLALKRDGVWAHHKLLVVAAAIASVLMIVLTAGALWAAIPWLATDVLSPSAISRYVFVPAIVGALIVVPAAIAIVRRLLQRKQDAKTPRQRRRL